MRRTEFKNMEKERKELKEILLVHNKIKPEIERKLAGFAKIGKGLKKNKVFNELCFCMLTPQSKAETCWEAVKKIKKEGLISDRIDCKKIEETLKGIRFHRTKSKRIAEAKKVMKQLIERLKQKDKARDKREWIVKNINGLGMKEATHFLRNIGMAEDLAILDRHILRKLYKLRIIEEIPRSISKNKYLEIEKKMQEFSKKIKIPVSHLDFVFWYIETGRIFK